MLFLPAATSELGVHESQSGEPTGARVPSAQIQNEDPSSSAAAMPQVVCTESEDTAGYFVAALMAAKLLMRSVNDVHSGARSEAFARHYSISRFQGPDPSRQAD